MAATMKKYGDVTIFHDGSRGKDLNALVLGARYDSGVKLGQNGEPALTLAYLNPDTPQNGPLKGSLLDAVVVVHDIPYLATEDLTAVGYSDTAFDYPVAQTPTLQEQLDTAMAIIKDLETRVAAAQESTAQASAHIPSIDPPATAAVVVGDPPKVS